MDGTGTYFSQISEEARPRHRLLTDCRSQSFNNSALALNDVMKYTIPSWLVIIGLKYQANPMSLLAENPVAAWCFVFSTSVYWSVEGTLKKMSNSNSGSFQWLKRAAFAAGLLTISSLISLLLPRKTWFVPLIIWIVVLLIGLGWLLIRWIDDRIQATIASVTYNARALVRVNHDIDLQRFPPV